MLKTNEILTYFTTGALNDDTAPVQDILINKYNRFVDGIFGRINKILKRSYDPVSVRLSTNDTKTKSKTKTTTKKRFDNLLTLFAATHNY